jgi:hypothetical protein
MRQFIRHPAGIPIEISADHPSRWGTHHASNLGLGGLAFRCERKLDPGSVIALRIVVVRPEFSAAARVVWCRESEAGFDLGVEFLDPDDAFRARMVEQVCHIEKYRLAVQREEGRVITAEEAAMEWINRHAAQFPGAQDGFH